MEINVTFSVIFNFYLILMRISRNRSLGAIREKALFRSEKLSKIFGKIFKNSLKIL